MNRTLWLALPALMVVSQVMAQTAPAPAAPAAPAAPTAPAAPAAPTAKAPAAPTAPAKPTAAAPAAAAKPAATPAAPAAATKPAAPAAAAPAAAKAPAAPAAAKAPAAPAAAKAPVAAQAAPPAAATAAKPAAPAKPGPVDWTVDAGHSRIAFVSKHLGFSKVEGQFNKFTGTVKADSKSGKISALEATVDAASIDTGIEKRDTHLKSDDFLNATQFPQLKLVLKTINWAGNKFTAKADLTIRDVTKTVTVKGELLGHSTVNFGQGPTQRAGYEASTKINRKEFGLKYSAVTEGLALVGDEVEIKLQVEIGYTAPPPT